jgi:hypothetical protein
MPVRRHVRTLTQVRCGLLLVLASGLLAAPRPARASELSLSWDRCSAAGVSNKAFICNTNAGADTLVVSYAPPFSLSKVAYAEVYIGVCFQDSSVPPWWQVLSAAGCRSGALTIERAGSGSGCSPIWSPDASVTTQIVPGFGTPSNGFRFVPTVTLLDTALARDFVVGQKYELLRLAVGHSKSVGAGACTGCAIGAKFELVYVRVFNTTGGGWGEGAFSSTVTWQEPSTECQLITPVKNRTWGQLKSLYR